MFKFLVYNLDNLLFGFTFLGGVDEGSLKGDGSFFGVAC